ncbi:HAMP domain-containing protein [Ferrovibrio terrae]|uniref:HAMP domain-containing protein n=1 Tax=Ferrovibrio terrae TaxID=2594003 RepID=A0A516GZM6_9PROT|nr:methyl-accepting chemotaxis protein [Ferrovibrio terrae]QDO96977.1 HAMP domain-containing protein [Ferrovibrio terrae]
MRRRLLSWLKIGPRIYLVIAIMALLTVGIGWMGIFSMDRYETQSNQMSALAERALISQRVVSSIVNTRGLTQEIYVAEDGERLKALIAAMNAEIISVEQVMVRWEGMLPPETQKTFIESVKKPLQAYFTNRRAIMATVQSDGVEAAREIGRAPAVLKQRDDVIETLRTASERNSKAVDEMNDKLTDFYTVQRPTMIWSTALGLLAAIVLAALIVVLTITRPITRITGTMGKLAEGDLGVNVDGAQRTDEIGAMAKTVQVFKDNMVARAEAEAQIESDRQKQAAEREAREARERAAIAEISDLCDTMAAGDLEKRLNESDKDGFLLTMSQKLNGLAGMLQAMTGELATITTALADGDVTKHVEGDYAGVFGTLKDSVNRMADTLKDFAGRLRNASSAVRDASGEISAGSQDLAQRTESQAASIEETAASMHEITATVKQNADNAQAANQLAGAARQTAEKGGRIVTDAVTAMNGIEQSAQKISDIVGLIDEIAFQTNLLALNASVEAARAGEAGKGFAVVAQEVRALAQRSASASKDIKGLIQESNAQVRSGAGLVQQTGSSLDEIVNAVKKVADIVAEIAAASREQATGLDQINTAVASMDETTQRNGALVEETSAAAQALSGQAHELNELVGFFRTGEVATAATNVAAVTPRAKTKVVPAATIRPVAKPAVRTKSAVVVGNTALKAQDDTWEEF